MTVFFKDREIILLGTAHISHESIEEVRRTIHEKKPHMVCVELDESRYTSMTRKDDWEKLDLTKVFREGKGFLLMANLVLSGFQRRIGAELGIKPGEEMKTALETADALNIPHALCDREIQTTLRRAWARCGLWNKCKLLASLLSSAFTTEKLSAQEVENLKNRSEVDDMMGELADYLPPVKETLIDERDRYLAAKIWTSASALERAARAQDPVQVIAVVGAGHLQGIKTHLEKIAAGDESPDISALDTIPTPGIMSRAASWIIPFLIIGFIALGFFRSGIGVSMDMLLHWILFNCSLAALGAFIALGHPLSILAAFIGAPIGTLSPFLGVGLFSGITEATLRKPRVADTQTLGDDICSLKGIYRNRITRALLVFFLSSLGGAIGNFISIPSLAGLLMKGSV